MEVKYSALIGNPIKHSVSDIMFKALITSSGFFCDYKHAKIAVSSEELKSTLEMLLKKEYVGLNVTLPHKQAIMKYINEVDVTAAHIGAVNTIKIKQDSLTGYNTDWIGLYKPMLFHSKKSKPMICIFGTGGASRAAIHAAKKISEDVYVFYRTSPNISDSTRNLMHRQKELGVSLRSYCDVKDIVSKSDIIINTTSTGMKGNIAKTPFNIEILEDVNMKEKLFIDAVFNPVETALLQFFTNKGSKAIDGLWMMIYQGMAALSIWLERDISVENTELMKIHKVLMEAIS
ncbi:shikimate dehydrogenase [Bacillus cereus]